MIRFRVAVLAVAVFGLTALAADKKKEQPLKGNWVRESDSGTVTIQFKSKDRMIVIVEVKDGGKITATNKYEADKDGNLKGTVKEVTSDGDNKPPVGLEFKFKFKIKGDKATLSDFEADNGEGAKAILEGDYNKKKGD
jgi:hypothetical protein